MLAIVACAHSGTTGRVLNHRSSAEYLGEKSAVFRHCHREKSGDDDGECCPAADGG
jgi:hypothetical protein